MIPYPLLRPLLFAMDAERAHELTIDGLAALGRMGLEGLIAPSVAPLPRRVMGIDFPNPVGLAAGLDKNAECIDAMAGFGFGFIEVGTVTPQPQPGNPKPRMFRLPQAQAIINRMGFNNHGVEALLANVRAARFRGVLGINIGKNAITTMERAANDYLAGLKAVYPHASYVTVNISSPNTRNLRELQQSDALDGLLAALKAEQARLADNHGRYVPLAVKIAPDLDDAQVQAIAALLMAHRIDAVIATNTTLARDAVQGLPHAEETGGLSGAPVRVASTRVVAGLARALAGALPIIGVGGILSGEDAREKIAAGASLVQVYTGLIYRGPGLVRECVEALR